MKPYPECCLVRLNGLKAIRLFAGIARRRPLAAALCGLGGAVAGIGGALMFGALPRLEKRPRVRNAVLLGLGLAILANSRPYEGLGASIPVAAALLWRPSRRALVPVAIAVSITGAATAYYCWRTTDHPFLMAHQLNRETYAMARFFLWEQPRSEPIYRHAVMRQFYTEWEPNFQNAIGQNTLSGWLSAAVEEVRCNGDSIWGGRSRSHCRCCPGRCAIGGCASGYSLVRCFCWDWRSSGTHSLTTGLPSWEWSPRWCGP